MVKKLPDDKIIVKSVKYVPESEADSEERMQRLVSLLVTGDVLLPRHPPKRRRHKGKTNPLEKTEKL